MLSVGAIVAGSVIGSVPAGAGHKPSAVGRGHVTKVADADALATLYNQNNLDQGIGIVSQNFETANDIYDSQAADDFVVPHGQVWIIKTVIVTGVYFNGSGPAASENVTFYKDGGVTPGTVVASVTKVGTDAGGSFTIKVGQVALTQGHYWVSVQANMDFSVGGEWGWETRTTQRRYAAQWQNPGDGFATGCTGYGVMTSCIPSGEGPDLMFKLKGTITT
jgi:hypothetical protein